MGAASRRTRSLRAKQPPHHPPKGRKIVRGEQLKRNSACLTCRRRRIKCDAGKPRCSSCVRSLQYLERTQPNEHHTVDCQYDDNGSDNSSDGDGDGQPKQLSPEPVVDTSKEQLSSRLPLDDERQRPEPVARTCSRRTKGAVAPREAQISTSHAYIQYALSEPSPMVDENPQYQSLQYQPFQPPGQQSSGFLDGMWSFGEPQMLSEPGMAGAMPNPYAPPQSLPMLYSPSLPNMSFAPETTLPSMTTSPGDDDFLDVLPSLERQASRSAPVVNEAKEESMDQWLMWPTWPSSLPSPILVNHLVDVFFTMVPSISRTIHRTSLLTRLSFPPTHSEFPHLALIHAICAVASRHSAAINTRTVQENIAKMAQDVKKGNGGKGDVVDLEDEQCFSEQQAICASHAMGNLQHVGGRGLFDVLQATVLMCHWGQSDSRWMDCWTSMGTASRLVICLGLLSDSPPGPSFAPFRRSILPPPRTDAEREERRAVLWYVLWYDATGSASSGWPGTLPHDEISSRMPSGRYDFERRDFIPENPQSYTSPDIYYHHPVPDSFVMLLKGKILLHRAAKFVRGFASVGAEARVLVREMADFKGIERDLASLSLTWPSSLRDPIQYMQGNMKTIDSDLISAHLVPHVVAIHLHQPFADVKDPFCPSAVRLLVEVRACLKIVYQIISSNADITFMVAPITSCDYIHCATKPLLMFYRHALETADEQAASTLHSEIAVLKDTFTLLSVRHSMGVHHLAMINTMLDIIEHEVLGHPVVDGDFSKLRPSASHTTPPSSGSSSSMPRSSSSYLTAGHSASLDLPAIPPTHPDAPMVQELRDTLKSKRELREEEGQKSHDELVRGILGKTGGFVNTVPGEGTSGLSGIGAGAGIGTGAGEIDADDPSIWLDCWQSVEALDL
ncbi:hypothetical protein IAR50_005620 [Cryptococcus sp. DSM 104548]